MYSFKSKLITIAKSYTKLEITNESNVIHSGYPEYLPNNPNRLLTYKCIATFTSKYYTDSDHRHFIVQKENNSYCFMNGDCNQTSKEFNGTYKELIKLLGSVRLKD